MAAASTTSYCELHVHLLGWPTATQTLARIEHKIIDWSAYENGFDRAYGRPANLRSLLSNWHLGLPEAEQALENLYIFGEADGGNFDRFQAKFDLISWSSALASTKAKMPASIITELQQRVAEVASDCRTQHIAHCELRTMLPVRWGDAGFELMIDALLVACEQHSSEDLFLCLAISLPRGHTMRWWPIVERHALGHRGRHLSAVDLCGCEEYHPLLDDGELATALHAFNHHHPQRALALLVHVGESYRDRSIESAIRSCHEAVSVLGAHRIAHALALGLDPRIYPGPHERYERVDERVSQICYDLRHADALNQAGVDIDVDSLKVELAELRSCEPRRQLAVHYGEYRLEQVYRRQQMAMQALAELGAVIEVCPTCNVRVAGLQSDDHHPISRFLAHGLKVIVGSDNPGLLNTTLAREYYRAAAMCGLDEGGRDALAAAAWNVRSAQLSGRITAE